MASACGPLVIQFLVPLRMYPSCCAQQVTIRYGLDAAQAHGVAGEAGTPSLVAVADCAPASEPLPGSESAKHPSFSPDANGVSHSSFCLSVPKSLIGSLRAAATARQSRPAKTGLWRRLGGHSNCNNPTGQRAYQYRELCADAITEQPAQPRASSSIAIAYDIVSMPAPP